MNKRVLVSLLAILIASIASAGEGKKNIKVKDFKSVDADGNGAISLTELTDAYKHSADGIAKKLAKKTDMGEAKKAKVIEGARKKESRARAVFATADADGNGKLNVAEFAAVEKLLKKPALKGDRKPALKGDKKPAPKEVKKKNR